MPAYDFRCKECGYVFEIRASVKEYDAGLMVSCPTCNSDEVVRMITAAGFVTAGGGSSSSPTPQSSTNGYSCGCGGGGCGH